MQSADATLNRGCLLLALRRYSAAVHNMEQTVLLPSLLRDVEAQPDEENQDSFQDCPSTADSSCKDLYDAYLMLKTIRNAVESGMMPLEEQNIHTETRGAEHAPGALDGGGDAEGRLDFHLRGLFSIMGTLTKKSQFITTKYMDIIRIMN